MKTHLGALAALAPFLVALAAGCASKREAPAPSPGTAISRDGQLAYALDPDEDLLVVSNRKTKEKVAEVRVGKAPEHLVVGSDETLYVANRGSRSVAVIARGDWKVKAWIPVGLEPLDLVVTADNKTLYVVNASSLEQAEHGSLMAINLTDQQVRWELPLEGEPKGFSLVNSHTARVELYGVAEPLWVNLRIPAVAGRGPVAMGREWRRGEKRGQATFSPPKWSAMPMRVRAP